MKKILILLVLVLGFGFAARAQHEADKILGVYKAEKEGRNSKVKIFKYADGYRAQVIWLENMKHPDGTLRTDQKNPDPSKRNTPSDKIVLVEKVVFKNGKWTDGKIYDPTSGKVYAVDMYFDAPDVLTVKGKLGPFFKRVYWKKLK